MKGKESILNPIALIKVLASLICKHKEPVTPCHKQNFRVYMSAMQPEGISPNIEKCPPKYILAGVEAGWQKIGAES